MRRAIGVIVASCALLAACTASGSTSASQVASPSSPTAFHNPSDVSLGGTAASGSADIDNSIDIKVVDGPVAVQILCHPGAGPRADVELGGDTVSYPCDGQAFVTEFTPDKPADHVTVRVTGKNGFDVRVVDR